MSRKKHKDDHEEEDVKIKKVRILGGIVGTIVAAVFYLGIPYFMKEYFIPNYTEYLNEVIIVWDNIIPLLDRWFYAGIPMVVLGAMTWAFPKGSRQRFLMSTIYLAASIVWLIYVLNFGDLTDLIRVTYDGNTYEVGIVLTFILYLMVLFRALKFLILYGTYKDHRRDYLDGE